MRGEERREKAHRRRGARETPCKGDKARGRCGARETRCEGEIDEA